MPAVQTSTAAGRTACNCHDNLLKAVEEVLLAYDDNAVAGKDSGGNVVLRGSFIAAMERLRAAKPTGDE